MKQIFIILSIIFSGFNLYSQDTSLKEKALDEFKNEHYDNAIKILEQAEKENPNDAEIYYYLGFFNHYHAYDSRPLNGYDFSYSEKIFEYLDKAIELDPNYGNAKYFYGAECSGNAFQAMQSYNLEKLEYFYVLAYDKGAYPKWLLEYGKNMLASCDKNSILFMGGNADFDICFYLQLHQNYRTDITIIPIGNIDRPWYIKFLKRGLKGAVKKINVNLTENQIDDIHPFKWKTTNVEIALSTKLKEKHKLSLDYKMQWEVKPDLSSNREHSKIESEKAKKRTFLSPRRALFLQIIDDNFKERPIFFSNATSPMFFAGLDKYFQNFGLISKLTPIKTENTAFEISNTEIENLLQKEKLKYFSTIIDTDIPRISGIVFGYHSSVLKLAQFYSEKGNNDEVKKILEFYNNNFLIDFNKEYENYYKAEIKKMIK